MANVYAVKSGNWSDTTVWNTGAYPTSSDDVFSNNFVVTMDRTTTVLTIRSTSATGITAGGYFVPADGVTVTCSSANGIYSGSSAVIRSTLTAGQVFTLNSAIIPSNFVTSAYGITHSGAGTLNVNGNMSNSLVNSYCGISVTSGTLNYTGSISASFNNTLYSGIQINGASAVANITGSLSNNTSGGYALLISNCTSASITGSITNSGGGQSVYVNGGAGTITVTGNCTGATATAITLTSSYSGTCNVVGQLQGGTSAAVSHTSGGLRLTGPFLVGPSGVQGISSSTWRWHSTASTTYYQVLTDAGATRPLYTADSIGGNPATSNVRSGTVYGPANELTGTCAVPGASSVAFGVAVDATTGTAVLTQAAVRSAMGLASANLDSQLAAAAADSSGTTTLLGRLTATRAGYLDNISSAPPSAASIRSEIDTNSTKLDATISSRLAASSYTAPPTTSAIRTELSVELARIDAAVSSRSTYAGGDTSGTTTLLGRLTSTRASGLDNLDATVSSRLASSGYTTPPTVGDIATGVWAAATRTLTTAIDNSATIAAAVWSYATGRTITGGTVTDLTNAPDVPTPEEIAAEVWSTTTREITGGVVDTLTTAPDVPSVAEIATGVRTELSPELARLSNTATTQEVAEIVQDAIQP